MALQRNEETLLDSNLKNGEAGFNEKILAMMIKDGYEPGKGLGLHKQGRVSPIHLTQNKGTRGLGLVIEDAEAAAKDWDPNDEVTEVQEEIHWLESYNETKNCKCIEETNLDDWIVQRPQKLSIDDETQYCEAVLLEEVLRKKEVLGHINPSELYQARARANPFETIGSAFFMNRAALKMANIDAITGFMFTGVDTQKEHKQSKTPYFFADICAGPGGFSEYILWRKRWHFKGFGLTLKGDNDFRIHDSNYADAALFEAIYGETGDGDIYQPANIEDFCSKIKNQTNDLGVHFVMGDGGFSVEGQENLQEILSKQLYICQCCTALECLRTNGHFVVKTFDLFTPFSVGLVYLMYHCFQRIAIIKPNSSRPANSERYLVCSKLKHNKEVDKIRRYIKKIVRILWDLHKTKSLKSIYEIVPQDIIKNDQTFFKYICNSNNRTAKRQIIGLNKLIAYCVEKSLVEEQQTELRFDCLQFWRIPHDKTRNSAPEYTIKELVPSYVYRKSYIAPGEIVDVEHMLNIFQILHNQKNWHCTILNRKTSQIQLYAGLKGSVKTYDRSTNRWEDVPDVRLVRGTVLFGELAVEKNPSGQQCKYLNVIDAVRLGDIPLADLHYEERLPLIKIYCQATNPISTTSIAVLRMRNAYKLDELKHAVKQEENSLDFLNCSTFDDEKFADKFLLIYKTDLNEDLKSTLSSCVVLHPASASNNKLEIWRIFQKSIMN